MSLDTLVNQYRLHNNCHHNKYLLVNKYEPNYEYLHITKDIHYFDESYKDKILITGPNCSLFLNKYFSNKDTVLSNYKIIKLKNNYLKIQVFKINNYNVVLIGDKLCSYLKQIKRLSKSIKDINIYNITSGYDLYSFFNPNNNKPLSLPSLKDYSIYRRTNHNNLFYDSFLVNHKNKQTFKELIKNYFQIGEATYNQILIDNNIIPFFNNIDIKYKKKLFSEKENKRYKIINIEIEIPFCPNINQKIYTFSKESIGKIIYTYNHNNKTKAFCAIKENNHDNHFYIKNKKKLHLCKLINTLNNQG